MRATRSHGRADTAVIPAGWGASHAPVLARTRTATVSLSTGLSSAPVWNTEDEVYEAPAAGSPYASAVPASIVAQQSTGDPRVEAAGETLDVFDYLIGVDHGQDADEGHVVTVTACPGDALLVGRKMRVERVDLGAERFERLLYCTLVDQRQEAVS